MKRILVNLPFALWLIFFSLNGFSQEVTKVVIVNKPIKYVYRVVLESLNKCITTASWQTYVGAYYDDNDTASIYDAGVGMGHADSYKLKKLDKGSTEISYFKDQCLFCSMAMAEAKLDKTLVWINDGDRDCQFVGSPSNPTIIK